MNRDILPLDNATCMQAAQLLGRAFQDDLVLCTMYKGLPTDERLKRQTAALAAELAICVRQGSPLLIRDGDKIVAVGIVYPPGTYPVPIAMQLELLLKTVRGTGVYGLDRWIQWINATEKHHPKEPHYYLEFIGVEPALQGNGLGSAVLQHVIDKANQEQVGCYLENVTPRNNPLYRRFGFQTVHEEQIMGLTTWFMWRLRIQQTSQS